MYIHLIYQIYFRAFEKAHFLYLNKYKNEGYFKIEKKQFRQPFETKRQPNFYQRLKFLVLDSSIAGFFPVFQTGAVAKLFVNRNIVSGDMFLEPLFQDTRFLVFQSAL